MPPEPAVSEPASPAPQPPMAVQPHDWQKLTPLEILRFARQWSLKSWLFLAGGMTALLVSAWSAGYSYRAGVLPEFAYVLEVGPASPLQLRKRLEAEDRFARNYDLIVDWRKLRPIAAGIMKDRPDGLDTEFEVAASLLAQIRATRGEARFLAGETEHRVRLAPDAGSVGLEWDEGPSLIPRIARDAGYDLTEEELRIANGNLNWAQFTYLDDAMEEVLIHRSLDGSLSLTMGR